MEEIEKQRLTDLTEKLFGNTGSEEEGMWKILSKYAPQYDELQILAMCKLTDIINIVSEPTKSRLQGIKDTYLQLCGNRNTARYMLYMKELDSLKRFMTEVRGQVMVQK